MNMPNLIRFGTVVLMLAGWPACMAQNARIVIGSKLVDQAATQKEFNEAVHIFRSEYQADKVRLQTNQEKGIILSILTLPYLTFISKMGGLELYAMGEYVDENFGIMSLQARNVQVQSRDFAESCIKSTESLLSALEHDNASLFITPEAISVPPGAILALFTFQPPTLWRDS